MMPSSRLHHPVNAHVENGGLGGSARRIVNLARKRFSQRSDPSWNLQKNLPRDTKLLSRKRSIPSDMVASSHSVFSLTLSFPLSFLNPLEGKSKPKKHIHAFKLFFQDLRIQPGEKSSRTVPPHGSDYSKSSFDQKPGSNMHKTISFP